MTNHHRHYYHAHRYHHGYYGGPGDAR
jgi:hypothetical protein